MDGFNPAIEALDSFAYEQGEWRQWTAADWNQQLLRYCFVRDHLRQPGEPLRATADDLPLLVRDPKAQSAEMVDTLVMKLRWAATQQNLDPLTLLAKHCQDQQRMPAREPRFFAFLWLTCLIAHGYPDADGEGRFWERFSIVFPRSDSRYRACIDEAWELLSDWLSDERTLEGFAYQPLELPPVDTWQPHITHSWNLAFPSLRDRQLLQRSLPPLRARLQPFQATNPALIEELLNQSLSAELHKRLADLLDHLQQGQPPLARTIELIEREIERSGDAPSSPPSLAGRPAARATRPAPPAAGLRGFGPLLLASMDAELGVLVLAEDRSPLPTGLERQDDNAWLPGVPLLVPLEPHDPDFAPFDAGSLAIDPAEQLLPSLQPLLQRGLLPFAKDPSLSRLRLAGDPSCGPISHVLVRNDLVPAFLEQFNAEPFECSEDRWQGFTDIDAEGLDLWRFPSLADSEDSRRDVRLSPRGGLPLSAGQGYLATGLGLPDVRVHGSERALKVALLTAGGDLLGLRPDGPAATADLSPAHSAAAEPQRWRLTSADRRRIDFTPGKGRLVAFFPEAPTVERSLTLSRLPARVIFKREEALVVRESWGRPLGALILPPPPTAGHSPSDESINQARERLNTRDQRMNPVFEEQMLDSLAALFTRRSSISRADFYQQHNTLLGYTEPWPLFTEAVLRGWCEGGWIEEGMEGRRGLWRLQPVDPRLVRLEGGRAQLVGLLPSRGLVELLAHAHELGMDVDVVSPSCPQMPRGWRFTGRCDELALRSGLAIVEQHHWVEDPMREAWIIDRPEHCDGPSWPSGLGFRMATRRICNLRGPRNHINALNLSRVEDLKLVRNLRGLCIEEESSRYGRMRWHSRDHNTGRVFSSCHRNRVALHASVMATDGVWPFGITDRRAARIERSYDARAYLPLPVGRHAALVGQQMPGPTRGRPAEHTYRYHLDEAFIQTQLADGQLPLIKP